MGSADTQRQERAPASHSFGHNRTSHDPFGDLNLLLGYAIAIIAIAMLAYTFLPEIRPSL